MKTLYLAAALAMLAMPAFAQTGASTAKNAAAGTAAQEATPQQFVTKAGIGGMFEIEASKLAASKSKNPDIQEFARMMIEDHSKADRELKALVGQGAAGQQVKIPAKLDDQHARKLEQLQAAAGSDFDASYKQMQVDAHREAVALFSSYAKTGDNPELKRWAAATLPTLQQHFVHVQGLQTGQRTGDLRQ